jgi:hypothetical protein
MLLVILAVVQIRGCVRPMRIAKDGSICILRRSAFSFAESKLESFRTTANPIPLPKPKPRAMREHLVVPPTGVNQRLEQFSIDCEF